VSVAWNVRTRIARLGLAVSLMGLLAALVAAPVGAAAPITLTTPYPAIAVAPGAKVTMDISITTTSSGRVELNLAGAPAEWNATLRGGGFAVDSVDTTAGTAAKVTLDATVPDAATGGTTRMVVTARQGSATATLPVTVRVEPNVAGSISLTTDTPSLKGASDASFSFTLSLKNDTPDDQTFTVASTGPAGWTITSQVGSQSQAASVVITAGNTSTVTVTAKAATDAAAGKYPIAVDATAGTLTAHADLSVEITGSYNLSMTTGNGVLSTNASAGSATDLTLVITNSGTADVANAKMTATPPNGWTVTFDPDTANIAANGTANVVAHMTPSSDAIAGDYMVTFKTTADVANASADVRVTVQTSPLWGIVGIGIIAIVLIGLLWVFRQFGRR
jgi:uncharacterized membrane protein